MAARPAEAGRRSSSTDAGAGRRTATVGSRACVRWSSTTPGPSGPSSARSSRELGIEVVEAGNGREGLEQLQRDPGRRTGPGRLEHAGDERPRVHPGRPRRPGLRRGPDHDGHHRDRAGAGDPGAGGRGERVPDEAVHQGHPGRQAQPARRASRSEPCRRSASWSSTTRSSSAGWWPTSCPPTRRIEVVGTAANGRIALAKLPQVNPDLVILDVEMPEMDGLATLRELRKTLPEAAGHHVQRPDRARGGGDARRPGPRGDRLLHQARPDGRAGRLAAGHPRRADPGDQGAVRPPAAAPAAAAGRRRPDRGRARDRAASRWSPSATSTGGPNALAEVFAGLPGRPAGADRDRPAHAADVHPAAGRAAVGRVAAAGRGGPARAACCGPGTPGSPRATTT